MPKSNERLARWFLKTLAKHLSKREKDGGALSIVGYGAGFEAWLAIEARIAIENDRAGLAKALGRSTSTGLWTATEYPAKVDLSIGDKKGVLAAFELKVAHNNKNWRGVCDGVWSDLFPERRVKKEMVTPRFAVVASVWKKYLDPRAAGYLGQDHANGPDDWRARVREYLRPPAGWEGLHVEMIGKPVPFAFRAGPPELEVGAGHGLELEIAVART